LKLCVHDNAEPPTIVRLYRNASREALEMPGVTIVPHEQANCFVVEHANRKLLASWAQEGIAQVQDPTAASVAANLDLHPGQIVLDRCAGLGTKTLQIRDLIGGNGEIHAVDPAAQRCAALKELLHKREIANVQVHRSAWLEGIPDLPRQFDRILIDAPCSNSGVLARRGEARYHQDVKSLESLVKLQHDILNDTIAWLGPKGVMVYSTCSIWVEENEDLIAEFIAVHPELKLRTQATMLPSLQENPSRYHDGGFFAVICRESLR
jgi:16S rRNA (cytosine967-C5)-methyltransferase